MIFKDMGLVILSGILDLNLNHLQKISIPPEKIVSQLNKDHRIVNEHSLSKNNREIEVWASMDSRLLMVLEDLDKNLPITI